MKEGKRRENGKGEQKRRGEKDGKQRRRKEKISKEEEDHIRKEGKRRCGRGEEKEGERM